MTIVEVTSTLDRDGFVRVESAFSSEDAASMCGILWDVLEREFGIWRGDPGTWTRPFRKRPLDEVGLWPVFGTMFTEKLGSAVGSLLGASDWSWPELGDFLITFPNAPSWALPHTGWHQDWTFGDAVEPLRFFKAFAFLNEVGQGGGGTLVVQGSHRLAGRYELGRVLDDQGVPVKGSERLYKDCSWLRGLCTPGDPDTRSKRFIGQSTDVDGLELKVVELTGRPGDVVIIHPWLIHAIAPNAATSPRFMRAPVFGVGT